MEDLMMKKSIFKQNKRKTVYKKNYYRNGEPYVDYDNIDTGEQYKYECNLSMPLLSDNDRFYIEEDDKTVQIAEVVRTSKDNILYTCYAEIIDNKDEEYEKVTAEVDKEKEEFKLKKQEKVVVLTEPSIAELTGFRKLIKNLFKL